MQKNDDIYGNSLLVVIIDRGKGSEILNTACELGIRGATAFYARWTAPGKILRLLELCERQKEVIMIALPTRYENEMVQKLTDRFHFDRPNKGIIFTLGLSSIYGSCHLEQEASPAAMPIDDSLFQAVMVIVDKGRGDSILDYAEEHGFPRGTVIDAHGSADKSNIIQNLMLEPEKDIILIYTTREQAQCLAVLLTDYLNLESANIGVLVILNLRQLVGVTLRTQVDCKNYMTKRKPDEPGYSIIFTIVENNKDEAVIQSAELAGSRGGTIIHARGSRSYLGKTFFPGSIEPEREIVIIIAENDKVQAICNRINTDLQLELTGKGIIFVAPVDRAIGLV